MSGISDITRVDRRTAEKFVIGLRISNRQVISMGVGLKLVCVGLLVMSGGGLWAESPYIRPALPAGEGGVSFESFQELDWEKKARGALTWLSLENPDATQLARLKKYLPEAPRIEADPDTAVVAFRPTLDTAVSVGPYFLVTPKGIYRVRAARLEGEAQFQFDKLHARIVSCNFRGRVVALPVSGQLEEDEGGFVFASPDGSGAMPENQAPAASSVVQRLRGEDKVEDVEQAFTFRLHGSTFLFVKWKGYPRDQRVFCAFEYSLYLVGSALSPLEGVAFACDI